jgi:hypothetical protein
MEHWSALKVEEVLTHATTWANLEDIILSEVSQPQKGLSDCTFMRYLEKSTHRDRSRWWLQRPKRKGMDSSEVGKVSILQKKKGSRGRQWGWLPNNVNVLKTTKLYV